MPVCDGWTDRQTDTGQSIYRARMASLGVNVSSDVSQGSAAMIPLQLYYRVCRGEINLKMGQHSEKFQERVAHIFDYW